MRKVSDRRRCYDCGGTLQYSHVLHLDADCVMIKPVDELFEMQVPFMCAASRVLTAKLAKLPKFPKASGRSRKEGPWSRPKPPSPHAIDLRSGPKSGALFRCKPARRRRPLQLRRCAPPCLIPRRGSYALDLSLTPKSFLPAENPELAEPDRRAPAPSGRATGCSAAGYSEYSALGTPDVLFPVDG